MDLAIALDSNCAIPLHQQLSEELRQAILNGRLLPRQRIPSTRSLSKSLGISRTTVTQSYEQLLSEGYLQTIVGSGTFVSCRKADTASCCPCKSCPTINRNSHRDAISRLYLFRYTIAKNVTTPQLIKLIKFPYSRIRSF